MKTLYSDLLAAEAGEASFKKLLLYFFMYPDFTAVVYYRLYTHCYKKGGFRKILSKLLRNRFIKNTGCELSPKSIIGEGLRIPHATGIVIGDGVVIGKNIRIYQNVTIGENGKSNVPVIEDGVTIFAGACVIGNITIGQNSVIGANSVVTKDVPANSVVAGIPAKVIQKL